MNSTTSNPTEERLLTRRQVSDITGFQRAAIYNKMNEGTFPKPAKFGCRANRWAASEIYRWVQNALQKRS